MTPAADLSGVDRGALRRPIPGEREPGMLTTFGALAASMRIIPDGPRTMDAPRLPNVSEREAERRASGVLRVTDRGGTA